MRTGTREEIASGKTTDIYFERTVQILRALDVHKTVTAEVRAARLPEGASWAVAAGLGDALSLLEGRNVDADAVEEGTIFGPGEPILQITGDYLEFGLLETAILGYLCQQSGVATKAARCRKAAGERLLVSFGARRMHPALAPVIDRAAYIGGCDGVSVVLSAQLLGIEPTGTMPHALVLILGDVAEAIRRFDEIVDPKVPRVALVDTFSDEKAESLRAARALGEKLAAVRLDTPGSRRGDMAKILEEVRWELDLHGFEHVKIMVSGGLDEHEILRLNEFADGYGVGTSISSAQTIDFALDIVEIDGKPLAKRGKKSGRKALLRCDRCFSSVVVPYARAQSGLVCQCGGTRRELLAPAIRNGSPVLQLRPDAEVRKFVLGQLEKVELEGQTSARQC
ncbi:MAG: nicotinate phosphoribosyltransferase [Armatimonadota bacterium]